VKALKNIFAEGRSPSRIRTDKGQEFRSRLVVSLEAEMDRTFVCTEYRSCSHFFILYLLSTNFPSFLTNLYNLSGPAKLAGFDES
jgi:hypothetical protein